MAKEAKLVAKLTLNQAPFVSGIQSAIAHAAHAAKQLAAQFVKNPVKFTATAGIVGAEQGIRGMASGLGFIAKTGAYAMAGLAAGAVSAGTALVAGTAGIIHMGSELEIMHRRTGMAIGRMSALKRVLEDNGVEFESIIPTIKKMSVALETAQGSGAGADKAKAMFAGLGLNAAELYGQDPSEAFTRIGVAISKLENPFQRAAASAAIFGRSGVMLLSAFSDKEGFAKAAGPLGQKAILLQENAERFHRITVLLRHTGDGLKSFFIGFASGAAKLIEQVLEHFHTADFSGVGLRFAAAMKEAAGWLMAAFKDPRSVAAFFWAELKLMAAEFVNWGYEELAKMFPSATPMIDSWIESARSFAAILGSGIEGAFTAGKAILEEMVSNPVLQALGVGLKAGGEVMSASGKALGAIAADLSGGNTSGLDYGQGFSLNGSAKIAEQSRISQTQRDARWRDMVGLTNSDLPMARVVGGAPIDTTGLKAAASAASAVSAKTDASRAIDEFENPYLSPLMLAVGGTMKAHTAGGAAMGLGNMMHAGLGGDVALQSGASNASRAANRARFEFDQRAAYTNAPASAAQLTAQHGLGMTAARGIAFGSAQLAGFGRGAGRTLGQGDTHGNILGHAEMRNIRNERIAKFGQAAYKMFGIRDVASGDHGRIKEFSKAQERAKQGKMTEGEALNTIAKSNSKIVKNTAALVKVFGEQPPEEVE